MELTPRIPPTIEAVRAYFIQKGIAVKEAECFFMLQEKRGWCNRRGEALTTWKSSACRWIASL